MFITHSIDNNYFKLFLNWNWILKIISPAFSTQITVEYLFFLTNKYLEQCIYNIQILENFHLLFKDKRK